MGLLVFNRWWRFSLHACGSVDPSQEGLPFAIKCPGIGPSGGINDDGVSAGNSLECNIQAPGGFDQPKSLYRRLRRDRPGDLDKLGCKQCNSPDDQGDHASNKTDDPGAFQWGGEEMPCGSAD